MHDAVRPGSRPAGAWPVTYSLRLELTCIPAGRPRKRIAHDAPSRPRFVLDSARRRPRGRDLLRPQSRHRQERAVAGLREPGDPAREGVGRAGAAVDRVLRRSRRAGVRLRDRPQDGQGQRAAQPALGVPRRERRLGQRLRAARRVHLRDPRPHDLDQRRGRAGDGGGARDRARDQPALGPADQQAAGGPARPRCRQHPLERRGADGRAREPGPRRAVPQVQPRRREPGRRGGLPLRVESELRRARDGERVPDARPGERCGGRRQASRVAGDAPESRHPHPEHSSSGSIRCTRT